jgi:hypothetical protein
MRLDELLVARLDDPVQNIAHTVAMECAAARNPATTRIIGRDPDYRIRGKAGIMGG